MTNNNNYNLDFSFEFMYASRYFKKRNYTFSSFLNDTFSIMRKPLSIRGAMKSERINPQFRERIMLAVTSVNGCIYCEWGHTRKALEYGCTEEEIKEIFRNDFRSCDPEETVALAFAQHYANTEGHPTAESCNKLIEQYGEQKANDIKLFIQMITFGNLLGNTIEAFESRFKGKPPENGSVLFESFIYILGFPFIKILNRKIRKLEKTEK
jgi:AhpD family alkylhydroperoxidase